MDHACPTRASSVPHGTTEEQRNRRCGRTCAANYPAALRQRVLLSVSSVARLSAVDRNESRRVTALQGMADMDRGPHERSPVPSVTRLPPRGRPVALRPHLAVGLPFRELGCTVFDGPTRCGRRGALSGGRNVRAAGERVVRNTSMHSRRRRSDSEARPGDWSLPGGHSRYSLGSRARRRPRWRGTPLWVPEVCSAKYPGSSNLGRCHPSDRPCLAGWHRLDCRDSVPRHAAARLGQAHSRAF